MSKSPNILLPTVGGIALVGGLAVASMHRNSGEAEIALLRDRVAQVETHAANASEAAKAQAVRAEALAVKVAQVQAAAEARPASSVSLTAPAPQRDGGFGLGRTALPEEIAAWDVDVLPDGRGLPEGSGDVWTGEEVFVEQCAACHGDFAEGVDNWPVLAGGFDTLADEDPVKTVGSYWPYLSTVWDYVHRSMPFGAAGTLTADETYAITAYILYSNDLVDDDFVLSHETFTDVQMHNTGGFVVDDRPASEYAEWRGAPCMENCKQEVKVTMRSVFLVETPAEGGSESVMNHATLENVPSFTAEGPSFIPAAVAKPETTQAPVAEQAAAPAQATDGDAELAAAGEKVFRKCKACHEIGAGADNKSGPQLTNVMGRTFGAVDGFKYSNVFQAAQAEGRVWDEEAMTSFLTKPKEYLNGTKMSFPGLRRAEDIDAVIAYLKAASE